MDDCKRPRALQSAPGVAVERRLGCREATEGRWERLEALGALMWITWERLAVATIC